jgi:effector-binding domain-containing protein
MSNAKILETINHIGQHIETWRDEDEMRQTIQDITNELSEIGIPFVKEFDLITFELTSEGLEIDAFDKDDIDMQYKHMPAFLAAYAKHLYELHDAHLVLTGRKPDYEEDF